MFSEAGEEAEKGDRAGRESQDAAPEVAVPFGSREIVSPRAFTHTLLQVLFISLVQPFSLAPLPRRYKLPGPYPRPARPGLVFLGDVLS